jgi:hypothetical protein
LKGARQPCYRPGIESLEHRRREFEVWCATVRDPATARSEGLRRVEAPTAVAEYEVASLPDGRWAVRVNLEYGCGDRFGTCIPWTDFPSRADCVGFFLEQARRHFGLALAGRCVAAAQVTARRAMLRLLSGDWLFGFEEPEPTRETGTGRASRRHRR